ncbi:flagellar export protein FliJ [Candidatus Margulisiibacteriota bacterium]
MSRKAKPGKKFKYGLGPVLKVRGIKERQEKETFAKKQKEYFDEKEKEDQLEEDQAVKQGELRDIVKQGPISNFERVLRRRAHLSVLKKDIEEQVEKVIDATKKLEQQRSKLMDAMKDKKIMEKDKSNRLKEYDELMKQLEIKFLDEVATQRFKRKD